MTKHHIVHDADRDGWGSAALIAATVAPEPTALHPLPKTRDVVGLLQNVRAAQGDRIYVLDIPAPASWKALSPPPCELIWVDHHLAAWTEPPPSWMRVVLPPHHKATTTMKVLVQAGLVTLPRAMDFVRGVCRREPPYDWGLLFDALDEGAPDVDGFESLLGLGPRGARVPPTLQSLVRQQERAASRVEQTLAAAPITVSKHLVICQLADAKGIRLRFYSLALARRFPDRLCVLVHRRQLLYVGRDSRKSAPNLLAHFRNRGLSPSGHPYVCFVKLRGEQLEPELAALRRLAEAKG